VAIVVNTFCTANIPAAAPNPDGMGGGLGMLLVVFAGAARSSLPKSPSGTATQPGLKNIVVQASANGNVQNIPIQFNVE
jgi:hypothetical protein